MRFKISISFPSNYPYAAPTIKFDTPCYHPNVDLTGGAICLDILQVCNPAYSWRGEILTYVQDKWSAVYSVQTILLSLQSLLGGKLESSDARWIRNDNKFRFQNLTMHPLSIRTPQGAGTDLKVGDIQDPRLGRDADPFCNLALDYRVQDAADEVLPAHQRGWPSLSPGFLSRLRQLHRVLIHLFTTR